MKKIRDLPSEFPNIRVRRAIEVAEAVADQMGADADVGYEVAMRTMEVLEQNAVRIGTLCCRCKKVVLADHSEPCALCGAYMQRSISGYGWAGDLVVAFKPANLLAKDRKTIDRHHSRRRNRERTKRATTACTAPCCKSSQPYGRPI